MNELTPIVLVDTREKAILPIEAYSLEVATLAVGDYGIRGFSDWNNPRFIIERKSVGDLVGSLTRERDRFMRELEKMRQFQFAALVIEATEDEVRAGRYQSQANPESILQSLSAVQVRHNLHIVWAGSHENAARWFERAVRQFCKGIMKDYRRLTHSLTDLEIVAHGAT